MSKCLQSVDIDLCAAINYVQQTFCTIEKFRNNGELKNLIQDKDNFMKSKNDEFSFTPLPMNLHIL